MEAKIDAATHLRVASAWRAERRGYSDCYKRVSVAAAITDDSYTLLVATQDSLRIEGWRAIGRADRKNNITEM